MELLGLVLPIPGIPGELIQYEMVEIGERISYELIYYTGYMGTRTEMIYDMDGFRAWKRPVFFTRLVKLLLSLPLLLLSSRFLLLRIFPLAFYLTSKYPGLRLP